MRSCAAVAVYAACFLACAPPWAEASVLDVAPALGDSSGRRGGPFTTVGSFTMGGLSNRAGNSEDATALGDAVGGCAELRAVAVRTCQLTGASSRACGAISEEQSNCEQTQKDDRRDEAQ